MIKSQRSNKITSKGFQTQYQSVSLSPYDTQMRRKTKLKLTVPRIAAQSYE